MRSIKFITAGLIASAILAQPAFAQAGVLAEPNDLSLVALGMLGVFLGQRAARKAPLD